MAATRQRYRARRWTGCRPARHARPLRRMSARKGSVGVKDRNGAHRIFLPLLFVTTSLCAAGCLHPDTHTATKRAIPTSKPTLVPGLGQDDPTLDMNAVPGRNLATLLVTSVQVLPAGAPDTQSISRTVETPAPGQVPA